MTSRLGFVEKRFFEDHPASQELAAHWNSHQTDSNTSNFKPVVSTYEIFVLKTARVVENIDRSSKKRKNWDVVDETECLTLKKPKVVYQMDNLWPLHHQPSNVPQPRLKHVPLPSVPSDPILPPALSYIASQPLPSYLVPQSVPTHLALRPVPPKELFDGRVPFPLVQYYFDFQRTVERTVPRSLAPRPVQPHETFRPQPVPFHFAERRYQ